MPRKSWPWSAPPRPSIISEIPFHNPVGGVRVGRVNGQFVVNPTTDQRADSDLDLLVAGTEDALVMVECGAQEVQEADMVKALEFGHKQIKALVKLQKDLQAKVGKTKMIRHQDRAGSGRLPEGRRQVRRAPHGCPHHEGEDRQLQDHRRPQEGMRHRAHAPTSPS